MAAPAQPSEPRDSANMRGMLSSNESTCTPEAATQVPCSANTARKLTVELIRRQGGTFGNSPHVPYTQTLKAAILARVVHDVI